MPPVIREYEPSVGSQETKSGMVDVNKLSLANLNLATLDQYRIADDEDDLPVMHVYDKNSNDDDDSCSDHSIVSSLYTTSYHPVSPKQEAHSHCAASTCTASTAASSSRQQDVLSLSSSKVSVLKTTVLQKEEEISVLREQLDRATTSKCELLVACNDLDQQLQHAQRELHQFRSIEETKQKRKSVAKGELVTEVANLSNELSQLRHHHSNLMSEKEFEIAQLKQELLKIKMLEPLQGEGLKSSWSSCASSSSFSA